MSQEAIWVVDDDQSIRQVLERTLQQAGYRVRCFARSKRLLEALAGEQPALILSDIRMPGVDGIALLQEISSQRPQLPVIIMTAYTDLEHTVAAFGSGAFEYLAKPFDLDEVVLLVQRALNNQPARPAPAEPVTLRSLIGRSPAMQQVFNAVGRLSGTEVGVLITGESGTGKELIARALHQHSPRASAPLLAINAAAIPAELLESELFGHEKGAFTGADARRIGRFEQADGATLFLDEIGDMPLAMQTRLLRVLAEGEFYRVGGQKALRVDVRVIAATHQDVDRQLRAGRFREDLLHRLAVIRIRIPPLRERREDIAELAQHFLAKSARQLDCAARQLLPETLTRLKELPWPGNVRQLENVCRWLTVMTPGQIVHPEDLPAELLAPPSAPQSEGLEGQWQQALTAWVRSRFAGGQGQLAREAKEILDRTLIEEALRQSGGQIQLAARRLGWGRNTLSRKLRHYNIPSSGSRASEEELPED